jgi:CheY-like chemotaxis protein/two-component sensor histidine kinase
MMRRPVPPAQTLAETLHELRSPLGGIEAMAELLAAGPLNEEQTGIVAALRASAAHLRAIATRVLEGEEAAPVALGTVIDDVAASLGARCKARGLAFRLEVSDDLPGDAPVEGCALRQVLENLADNAVRLASAGHVALAICLEGGRLTCRISDSGPGISREDAARLIREGGAIAGREGGAGIGLSIAGRLVAARGGALVGGPSDLGGAAFSFDWPLEAGAPALPAPTPATTPTPAQEGQSILIVDDHPTARLVLKTILGAGGYACREAAGVEDALLAIAADPPGVVLTDLNMPEGGGRRLIAALAGMKACPKLIVVSGEALDPGLLGRVDGVIMKPVSVRAVLGTVAEVLAEGREAAA